MKIFSEIETFLNENISQYLPNKDKYTEEEWIQTCLQFLTSQSHKYPKYDEYAVKLSLKIHESKTLRSFVETMNKIQKNKNINGEPKPLLHFEFYQFIQQYNDKIDLLFEECLNECKEMFKMTYFGWKTLYRSYLIKTHEGIMERIEHLFFRVALFLYRDNWTNVKNTFLMFIKGDAIHATPTLYHAGLLHPQMASCFLVGTDDSVPGIFKTVSDVAMISKYAGGIGIHISNIRGENSYIYGTNGISNGIMPMLRVYNATSRYIDQCFDKDTLVMTSKGLIKICDIEPYQHLVLSDDGKFNMVKKKIIHYGDYEMLNVNVPWINKKFQVTPMHEFLCERENDYYSYNDMLYYDKLKWIDTIIDNGKYNIQDLMVLGYLYRNINYTNMEEEWIQYQIEKNDNISDDQIESFFNRHIKWWRKTLNNKWIFLPYQDNSIDYKLDWEGMINHKIPTELLFINLEKLKEFYKGFCISNKSDMISEEIKNQINTMNYRLNRPIMNIEYENIEMKKNIKVYDLEIENNPSYQTILGMAHNGGGKRKGAFAMYIEPWHSDIYNFIMAKRAVGNEEERARDLFYGLWIPDKFMESVELNGPWYLMGGDEAQILSKVWGSEFNRLYDQFIKDNRFVKKIQARDLWIEILKSQIETGTPYLLYKDTCNKLSNQKNIGTIKSSNLCCEIIEYSDDKEYAVCNLASISLKSCLDFHSNLNHLKNKNIKIYGKKECSYCTLLKIQLDKRNLNYEYIENYDKDYLNNFGNTYPFVFIDSKYIGGFKEIWEKYLRPEFSFEKLRKIVYQLVENLNVVIDKNDYPLEECKRSNMKHRPIGIGVQGLADVFMEMLEMYDSDYSRNLNKKIFEYLYFYALEKSNELAKNFGSYTSFQGSPLCLGQFHFDLYNLSYHDLSISIEKWNLLRDSIKQYGIRNSLLIAPMPTASTSQILGNTESFEPLTSNFYLRRTSAGEFYVINEILRDLLIRWNKWDESMIQMLILSKGTVDMIDFLPQSIKNVFRTVWEISQKSLIEMASDRQAFIDQSQSFNIYLSKPDLSILNKIHFYGWKKQLKTGCYYLRTRAVTSSQNFTIDPQIEKQFCESCSS